MIGIWKNKCKVVYISTEFENTIATSINRWKQERQKPLPIVKYNVTMHGHYVWSRHGLTCMVYGYRPYMSDYVWSIPFISTLYRAEQLQAYFSCEWKTIPWYMTVFEHTLGLIMSNAMQLHNIYHRDDNMNLYGFRLSVLEQLISRPPSPGGTLPSAGRHTIEISNTRGNDGRVKRKRCKVCHGELMEFESET